MSKSKGEISSLLAMPLKVAHAPILTPRIVKDFQRVKKHGPWTILESNKKYSDPWIEVRRDEVIRPDGKPGTYATVKLKSGVCVVAIDNEQHVHLTREFHYAVGRVTIEGVSGGIEENESPIAAATRELAEELGLEAGKWTHIGTLDPFTAAIHSTVDLYLAEELSECEAAPEGTELIEHISFPLETVIQMCRDSQITHSPTVAAIFRIALDFSQGQQA